MYYINREIAYNKKHHIKPKTIIKEIRDVISNTDEEQKETKTTLTNTPSIETIEAQMTEAAKNLDFDRAMELRDILFEMQAN